MRLEYVEIQNFRSIKHARITLTPSCRILVGINESGKSNILHALALLDPDREIEADDLREFGPEEDPNEDAYVRFVFALDKEERVGAYESVAPKVRSADGKDRPILSVNGTPKTLAQLIDSRTQGLYVANIRKQTRLFQYWSLKEPEIVGSWKKPAAVTSIQLPDGTALKPGDVSLIEWIPELEGQPLLDATAQDVASLVGSAITDVVEENLPGCMLWTYSDANLLPGQIGLDEFASAPDTCLPLKHMFILAGHKEIAKAVADAKGRSGGIRNLLKRVAEVATTHMQTVWKDYKGIRIQLQPNGDKIDAGIEDAYNVYNLARRSDGFKRFVTFLFLVSVTAKTKDLANTLYLHDEPDISLHPSGARHLRDELLKVARTNYVIYSTHSIFMVDRGDIGRHLIVEKNDEMTSVRQVDESNIVDEEVIYNALGHSVFESLKQKNIIFEGYRDKQLFDVALSRVPAESKRVKEAFSDVGRCHARGVKDVGRVAALLELANRKYVVLSDGDRPALEQQKLYEGDGEWIRYDQLADDGVTITGEDFVKAETIVSVMERLREEYVGLPEVKVGDLDGQPGRLGYMRRWLQLGGVTKGEEIKVAIDRMKADIFGNLKASQVEPKYYAALAALLPRLG